MEDELLPPVQVVLYKEDDEIVPVLDWLDQLPIKVQDKCAARVNRLMELGHELRRPEADYLRDGIYELRVRYLHANYRMLYFFSRNQAVVLTHGLIKERRVPPSEIDRAMTLRKRFEADPESHTVQWER
ncbi:MAG: type II toxin-antitoxin system RelE/ParE family toxin [Pseudomonadota bacterium]